jgi:hypothetical protein
MSRRIQVIKDMTKKMQNSGNSRTKQNIYMHVVELMSITIQLIKI